MEPVEKSICVSSVTSTLGSLSVESLNSEAFSEFEWNGRNNLLPDFKNSQTPHNAVLLVVPLYITKEVLMAASPYFLNMFGPTMTDVHSHPIELKDVELDHFLEFISQLYVTFVTMKNILIVLNMAEKYQATGLFLCCENALTYSLIRKQYNQDIFPVLQFAHKHNLEDMKNIIRSFFRCKFAARCQICKNIGSCDSSDKCSRFKAFYLPNDHICIKYKEEMMKLEPEVAGYVLECLLDSILGKLCRKDSSENFDSDVSSESESTDTEVESESESTDETGSEQDEADNQNDCKLNDILDRLSVIEKHLVINQNIDETTTGNELNSGKRSNTNELIEVEKKKPREMVKMSKIMNDDSDLSFVEESSGMGKIANRSIMADLSKAISFSKSDENLVVENKNEGKDKTKKVRFNIPEPDQLTDCDKKQNEGEITTTTTDCVKYGFCSNQYNDCKIIIQSKTLYVSSKIVCRAAKFFQGRLEKGSVLELSCDISSEVFCKFRAYIYPAGICDRYDVLTMLRATHFFGAELHFKMLLHSQEGPAGFKCLFECRSKSEEIRDLIEYAVKNNVSSLKKLIYFGGFKPYSSIECNHGGQLNCKETKDLKAHPFEADGIFNSLSDIFAFKTKEIFLKMTPEAKKFMLACLIKDKKHILS